MNAKRSSDVCQKKRGIVSKFSSLNLFSSGKIVIMAYESKIDDEIISKTIDQARFKKLQADMADIARKFKDRTARHQAKVSEV